MKHITSLKQLILCICILIFFLSGYASATITDKEKIPPVHSTKKEDRVSPSNTLLLKNIAIITKNNLCRVKIPVQNHPTYTAFKLSAPPRLIIDLQETQTVDSQKSLTIHNNYISSIKCNQVQDKTSAFLRIEMELVNDFYYNATNDNNSICIDIFHNKLASNKNNGKQQTNNVSLPKTKSTTSNTAQASVCIKNIKISQTPSDSIISIEANLEIEKYSSCSLQNPNRLVIDLPKTKSQLNNPVVTVGTPLIEKIRIGQKHGNTRIVIDINGINFPLYQITQKKNFLNVSIEKNKIMPSPDIQNARTITATKNTSQKLVTEKNKYTGEKISLDFKDADIKNVFRLIADISNLNIIISDNVSGKVTMKIENIPWDEALAIILETNNLGRIDSKNITRIETIEQIKRINHEKLLAKKSQEDIEELIVKTFDISYAKATDLGQYIKDMKILSTRGSITPFNLTNKLTIQDIPVNVLKTEKLIKEQDVPTRQVLIEARIIQSNPSYVKEMGVRWGGLYSTTHNGDDVTIGGSDAGVGGTAGDSYLVNLPAAAGAGSGGAISFGFIKDSLSLDVELTALENDNKIKIISSPRILGLDNKEARIKQGVALPYLKLSEEGVTSTEFKDAVLELTVTPKITPSNTIALHIYVTKNQRSSQTGAGNEPGIDVREVETDLLIDSGKTVVIGGIYETTKSHNISKVPFLGDLPYMGRFFRNEKEEDQLTELLVFLTVTVIEGPNNP